MSVSFRSSLRELHSSVGLVIGWIGFFLFLFGSLALYRSEITFWLQPETHEAALPHTGIEEKVRAARSGLDYLASRAPGESMWRIVLPTERMPLPAAAWASGEEVHAHHGMAPEYFDPEDGGKVEARLTRGGTFLYRLHVDLFGVDRGTGRSLIGMATLAMLVVLVSGVCLRSHFFRDFFLFHPRLGKLAWRDSHCVLGGLILPFCLLFSISGLVLLAQSLLPSALYPIYREDARSFVMESKRPPLLPSGNGAEKTYSPGGHTPWKDYGIPDPERLLRIADARWPECGAGELVISFQDDRAVSVEAVQSRGGLLARRATPERLTLVPDTGKIYESTQEESPSLVRSVWYAASAIHLGRFAGPLPRALLFLSGLLTAGMIAAGLILWERMREKVGTPPSSLRAVSAVNTALIAGLPLSVASFFWGNRLLSADLIQRDVWEMLTFFFVWACCFTHAWARPWPLARGEQLVVGGAALALLPVLNGMTGGIALPGSLMSGPWQLAGIDCAALAVGLGLLTAGIREHRRARAFLPSSGAHSFRAWLHDRLGILHSALAFWKKGPFARSKAESTPPAYDGPSEVPSIGEETSSEKNGSSFPGTDADAEKSGQPTRTGGTES